jgi:nucleotide-binding universal stress UspA family protein
VAGFLKNLFQINGRTGDLIFTGSNRKKINTALVKFFRTKLWQTTMRFGGLDMYNTILVPLDGSKRAETILRHVEELAKRYDAKVIFLKVEEDGLMLEHDEVADISRCRLIFEQRKQQAQTYLAALKGEFREKGIKAQTLIDFGSVAQAILKAAAEEQADLIAMASHGLSGLSRVFYGSVAASVLQRIDRPLLLIRTQE